MKIALGKRRNNKYLITFRPRHTEQPAYVECINTLLFERFVLLKVSRNFQT